MEKIFHGLPRRDGKPAIRLAGNTLQNDGERDIEEDHRAEGSQIPHGFRPIDHAAARGEHSALHTEGQDDLGLHVEEAFLVQGVRHVLKARAIGGFNQIVGIHIGPAEAFGHGAGAGAFSSPGHADKGHALVLGQAGNLY